MAKKINENVNTNPLESQTIGQIKTSKYGWIGTILLFVLFIGIVFFLPEINKYYEYYIKGNKSIMNNEVEPINNISNNTNTSQDEETDETYEKHFLSNEASFEYDLLKYSNFSFNNNLFSFSIINSTEEDITLKNTFVEVYNKSDQLINRILISGTIASLGSKNYSFNINNEINYFYIKKINTEDYTYIDLDVDNNNNSTLSCSKDYDTITYVFNNDKLIKIKDHFVYNTSNSNYNEIYSKYNTLMLTYSNINGITSTLNSNSMQMDYNLEINYEIYSGKLNNDYYYEKNTNPRIVNFEMESMFYQCK